MINKKAWYNRQMNKMTLGLVDSGLGGISVLKAIISNNPNARVIALADQENAPYGNKTQAEIIEYTRNNINWLLKRGASEILLACNTSSANALDYLKDEFKDTKIQGIIEITSTQLKNTDYGTILVLATALTVKSQAYSTRIKEMNPTCEVKEWPLPKLVDYLEGKEDHQVIVEYLLKELRHFTNKVSAVVLGCTHYPLVKREIESILKCPIYDSNEAIKNLNFNFPGEGRSVEIYTTGEPLNLEKQIEELFALKMSVKKANL